MPAFISGRPLKRVDGQAPTMARGGLQQNSDVDAASGCSIQCIDHRGDIICNEAYEKEVTLRVTDEVQEHLLSAAGGDEWRSLTPIIIAPQPSTLDAMSNMQ